MDELRARSPSVVLHDLPKTRPALDRLALHTHLKVKRLDTRGSERAAERGQWIASYGRMSRRTYSSRRLHRLMYLTG